jgi:hypothetical protein
MSIPEDWPVRALDPKSREPMPVPYRRCREFRLSHHSPFTSTTQITAGAGSLPRNSGSISAMRATIGRPPHEKQKSRTAMSEHHIQAKGLP